MAVNNNKKSPVLLLCLITVGVIILPIMGCGGGSGGGSDNPTPTPNISASKSSLDFAGVVLSNSADQTVEITNTGNANLSIGQISNSGPNPPFSIAADACSNKTLTPSQKCLLRARFAPTNQNSFTGTLSIPSNDPDSNVVTVTLAGTGYGLNVWINKVESSGCQGTIDVTVTDPTKPGTLLDLLTDQNFKVYQNGEVQGITVNPIEYPSPVSVVLALDFSVSEVGVLDTIRAAGNFFINQLNNGDFAAICKFSGDIGFYPVPLFLPGDDPGLISYINNSFPVGTGTLLFTALLQSIERAAQGTTDKRAVIVLSDGVAYLDSIGLEQVIAYANQQGIPIFTIYYVDQNYTHNTSEQVATALLNLQRLASESGGQYYNGLTADLTDVFGQIANVLSNKYTLTYSPATCSGTYSLDVRADWTGLYGVGSATITF